MENNQSRPDWLERNIKPNYLTETRLYKGRKYYWCCAKNGGKCEGKWRQHKPSQCYGGGTVNNKRAGIAKTEQMQSDSAQEKRKQRSDSEHDALPSSQFQTTQELLNLDQKSRNTTLAAKGTSNDMGGITMVIGSCDSAT